VLAKAAIPRRAFAVIYDHPTDHTFEAIANLTTGALDSWKDIPGAEPAIDAVDSDLADQIVRRDPRWAQAMHARGIRDVQRVVTMSWTAGYFALPGTEQGRIVRVVPYYAGAGQNLYAHPVEGVVAHVNLTTRKVLDFLDVDRDAPVSRENADLNPRALRPPAAPLVIAQPNGPGFQIEDGEVHWQKWRFRYALHPREGVVLYTVGYEDGGKVRPVMYRGSLSEMVVPYGDPTAGWFFRNSFDVGELGLGATASPLRAGVDCPANCTVLDAVLGDNDGEPRVIPGAVALFERDGGVEWKHADNTRRSRELVLAYWSQPGNYEYGFEWVFHQDGTLEMRVELTGIMAAKGVANGAHDPYSHLVAPNVAAPHHEHFFAFRLDMDVDGPSNRVVELNTVPCLPAPRIPTAAASPWRSRLCAPNRPPSASSTWRAAGNGSSRAPPRPTPSVIPPAICCCPARIPCPSRSPIPGSANAPASSTRISG
jgi:primary-amine oxidase